MDSELIKRARQTNLAEYLMGVGISLVRDGRRFRHREHDSLVFNGNAYYWNSRQEKGNAIDYLVRHMGMDFRGAVSALVDIGGVMPQQTVPSNKPFELNSNCDKAKAYLRKERCISNNVVDYLVEKRLLFQEKRTNNIIFPMRDEDGKCVGAELQGVTTKRFKGVKEGSKYGHGFNVRFSDDGTFDYALFFESAVDLISFVDYKQNHEKKTLERCILVSMAGLKINVVRHYIAAFDGVQVVLCVDNDKAGEAFKDGVRSAGIDYIERSPDEDYQDWNEMLIGEKKHSRPIQRLMERGGNVLV